MYSKTVQYKFIVANLSYMQFHFRSNEFDNIVTLCTLWYLGEIKQNIHKILIKMKILQSCLWHWVNVICVESLWHRYNGKLRVKIYIAYRVVWKLDLRYSLAKKVNVERLVVNRDQVLVSPQNTLGTCKCMGCTHEDVQVYFFKRKKTKKKN